MNLILLPAFISLILKLFILWTAIKGRKASTVFLSLISIFALHNAIELFALSNLLFLEDSNITHILRPFYIITTFCAMYIALHVLTISEMAHKYITVTLVTIATMISSLILLTDKVIAGDYSIGYSISAFKGEYYWLFAAFILGSLTFSIAALLYKRRTASTQLMATRCTYSFYALIPVFLVGASTIFFKIMDIPINATVIMPMATTLFLFIIIKTESKHQLSDIKPLLPLSLERKTADNFLNMLDEYVQNSNQDNVYKNLQSKIEREIICYSLKKSNNNITHTAKLMGLKNRSTLYSMINRHDIDLNELKKCSIN